MSLWCDKYRPKTLSNLDYHKEQADVFKKLVKPKIFFGLNKQINLSDYHMNMKIRFQINNNY